jgi:hypothetical protein
LTRYHYNRMALSLIYVDAATSPQRIVYCRARLNTLATTVVTKVAGFSV